MTTLTQQCPWLFCGPGLSLQSWPHPSNSFLFGQQSLGRGIWLFLHTCIQTTKVVVSSCVKLPLQFSREFLSLITAQQKPTASFQAGTGPAEGCSEMSSCVARHLLNCCLLGDFQALASGKLKVIATSAQIRFCYYCARPLLKEKEDDWQ